MAIKSYASYIVSILFICLCICILYSQLNFAILKNFTLTSFLLSIAFAVISFSISGLKEYFIIKHSQYIKLKASDILFLPVVMNFWSFIIPFKGGLLYNIFILKHKYKTTYGKVLSFNLVLYSLTIAISGVIGIIYILFYSLKIPILFAVFSLFFLNPVLIYILYKLLDTLKKYHNKYLTLLISSLKKVVACFNNRKLVITVLLLSVLHIQFQIAWFHYVGSALDLGLSVLDISVLVVARHVLVILRFTPGGLGFNELVSGGITGFLVSNSSSGIMLAIYIRLSTLILSFLIGPAYTITHKKYYKIKRFSLFKKALRGFNGN